MRKREREIAKKSRARVKTLNVRKRVHGNVVVIVARNQNVCPSITINIINGNQPNGALSFRVLFVLAVVQDFRCVLKVVGQWAENVCFLVTVAREDDPWSRRGVGRRVE